MMTRKELEALEKMDWDNPDQVALMLYRSVEKEGENGEDKPEDKDQK